MKSELFMRLLVVLKHGFKFKKSLQLCVLSVLFSSMTYQSSWGFSSFADDDLNVKLPILLGSNLTSNANIQNKQTEFLLKFKVTSDLVLLTTGKVQKIRIKGDFEQGLSNFQVRL
jgi:hypothetical protein